MIISETRGFIFIHNPKCGGTTTRVALKQFDTTGDMFWRATEFQGRKIDRAHMPLHMFRAAYPRYFDLMHSLLTFMFVRNPYTRTVSAFNESKPEVFRLSKSADEEERRRYVRELNAHIQSIEPFHLNGWSHPHRHFVRQSDFCFLNRKRLVDVTMKLEQWPDCLDQIATFEPELSRVLGGAKTKNVRRSEVSLDTYLEADSVRKINALYLEDFLHFGYEMNKP